MKLKLQTKITIIYALVFILILATINAAVFITMKFYGSNRDLMDIKKTGEIVQGLLTEKGTISNEDLYSKGIRFPMAVEVRTSDWIFPSMEGLKLINNENDNDALEFVSFGNKVHNKALIKSYEFIDKNSKSFLITIGKSQEEDAYDRRLMIITTAIASLIGVILSLAVGNYMSQESFNPITNMRKSVESLSAENLHDRIDVPDTGDELTELGNTFNSLLDRLDTAYLRQSKFVSDASHELRTPLTVIKGFTDMLERWGKDDPEILDEAIAAIKDETANMSVLVENLLLIAKGENNKLSVNYESFDLYDLIKGVTEETSMSTPDRTITSHGEPMDIYADKKMIKQLLRIFIENSIKFTDIDGLIRVSLERRREKGVIRVWDNGDGISPKDITRIFERFYVADKARTKDKSGSGLGLSIAKWIVDVHKGKLSVESIPGQYAEFIVELPLNLDKKVLPELSVGKEYIKKLDATEDKGILKEGDKDLAPSKKEEPN